MFFSFASSVHYASLLLITTLKSFLLSCTAVELLNHCLCFRRPLKSAGPGRNAARALREVWTKKYATSHPNSSALSHLNTLQCSQTLQTRFFLTKKFIKSCAFALLFLLPVLFVKLCPVSLCLRIIKLIRSICTRLCSLVHGVEMSGMIR